MGAYLNKEIEQAIFEPTLSQGAADTWVDNYEKEWSPYYNEVWYSKPKDILSHNVRTWLTAQSDYIEIVVDVFGLGAENRGLEWIADLATGGTGAIKCQYVSKLPARMKRKFDEYKEMIAGMLENYGFEILEAPKNCGDGFLFKVTDDAYDALIS